MRFDQANVVEEMKDEEMLQDFLAAQKHDMNLLGFHLQDYEANLDTDWSPLEILFLIPYKLVLVILPLAVTC